jgi:hypothetical protein
MTMIEFGPLNVSRALKAIQKRALDRATARAVDRAIRHVL